MRLGLAPWVADPAAFRRQRAEIRPGANAWAAHRLVVASIDYVKQPEVLSLAARVAWDLVVVDEAHNLGSGSDRRVAADALAADASRVLLITATPHAGSDDQFASLCAVGARGTGDCPAIVRRLREEVGLGAAARLRIVRVRQSPAERAMHELLHEYARQVWTEERPGAALAMAWLVKRAASSPAAFLRSVEHRRRALASVGSADPHPWLPFDDEVDERDERDCREPEVLRSPGLGNRDREVRVLEELTWKAGLAAREWRKGAWLARFVTSAREPIVLFTEYRDTLDAVAGALGSVAAVAVLHGGLSRRDRGEALHRFRRGQASVLLATDVAGEGLNLQAAARTVVSIELPWTPARLEQRAGRVDRLGQRKAARAACLVARTEADESVLARVSARAHRVRAALGEGGVAPHDELVLLAAALGMAHEPAPPARSGAAARTVTLAANDELDVAAGAWALRALAIEQRRLPAAPRRRATRLPWVRIHRRGADPWPRGIVVVFRARARTPDGRIAGDAMVALQVTLTAAAAHLPIRRLLRALVRWLRPDAERAAAVPLGRAVARFKARTRAELDRFAQEPATTTMRRVAPIQAGLFERRTITEAAQLRAIAEARTTRREQRLALDIDARIECPPPAPVAAFVCW